MLDADKVVCKMSVALCMWMVHVDDAIDHLR